jgi:Glyoxalase-like domain
VPSLDHAIVFVPDLDQAAPTYHRLGFDLTPRGGHPSLGTANHTIVFERDYLELLSVVRPGPGNERWARAQARGEGLGGIALATDDARASAGALRERGVSAGPAVDFARPVARPTGPAEARFTIVPLPDDATPGLPAFFCQHHTPELVWLPAHQRHPNTAFGVAGLTVVDPALDANAAAWERLVGRARVHPRPGGLTVTLGRTRLWLVTPTYATARLGHRVPDRLAPIGITVAIRTLAAAQRILAARGVPFGTFGPRSILVGPSWAAGVYLELLEAA